MENVFETSLVELDKVKPSFFQTRIESYDEELEDLVESIRKYGVLQAIVLRTVPNGYYEVIAGDRRCRAAREAGLKVIPATIREVSDKDALVLQATENLLRQGLSPMERTRIVTELARICKFKEGEVGQGIADLVKKSYTWVMMYLPKEYKNQDMAELGQLSAESKKEQNLHVVTNIVTECEFCTVSTSDPKEWENHNLCPLHYSQALEDPARFKRFFGFQQQHPVIGEHLKSEPLDSWEERKAHMSPQHSKRELEFVELCTSEDDLRPVVTDRSFPLEETIPDAVFPKYNAVAYIDDPATHGGSKMDKDEVLREKFLKRNPGWHVFVFRDGKPKDWVKELKIAIKGA